MQCGKKVWCTAPLCRTPVIIKADFIISRFFLWANIKYNFTQNLGYLWFGLLNYVYEYKSFVFHIVIKQTFSDTFRYSPLYFISCCCKQALFGLTHCCRAASISFFLLFLLCTVLVFSKGRQTLCPRNEVTLLVCGAGLASYSLGPYVWAAVTA